MYADSQDRVYVFHRAEPPVVVFGRDGNFLSSWGNGNFVSVHGLFIADDIIYLTDREDSVTMKYTLDGKPLEIPGTHGVYSDTGTEEIGTESRVRSVSMQIGMFYQMQVPRPSSRSYEADRFLEMLDQVAYAEEMGLSSVWMADHQFRTEWSHSSAPDVTLGALSQRTSRMRLGIAVVVPPVQHPLHIAARTATLDVLSKGRVDLGVGRSGYPYQMAAFGTDLEDATGMVDEALEIIPRAWTEGEFTYQGNHYKIPLREVHPKPVQHPHPPIWLGCSQEDTFRKAGLMGLGCLAMAGGGATGLAPLVQAYRDGIRNASPTTGVVHNRVSVSTVAICGESRKKVQERSAELIDWYRHQQALRDVRVWSEQDPSRVPEDYQWHYTRSTATDSPKREETSSLDQIRSGRYCIGDPDDCIRYLEAYAEAGVDEVMPLFQVGGISHEEVMDTLRLFGKHVIPHFNAKAS